MGTLPGPSKYQQAILDHLARPGGHLVIHATAGAGKTTVLTQIAAAQPSRSRQLYLAFARDAANELRQRLPPLVDTRTVHSLGRQVLAHDLAARASQLLPPQPKKYGRLARVLLEERLPQFASFDTASYLSELAGIVRLQLIEPDDEQGVIEAATEAGLWLPARQEAAAEIPALLPELIKRGLQQTERGLVDFTDMLYAPVMRRLSVPPFDLVCIDEAQDYSAAALELTLALAAAGARLVFVGDPRQSIFGFAGARPDAMHLIAKRLTATVLPLSVTYRCPRVHVELAREIAPEMESAPHAAAGMVAVITDEELESWVQPEDLILCRLNAPLMAACLRITRLGLAAHLRGTDLRDRLIRLASTVFRSGISHPGQRISSHFAAEEAKLLAADPGVAGPSLSRLKDELSCLEVLCGTGKVDWPDSLPSLEDRIMSMFGGGKEAVVLSTVHRAKGQEADRVALLYPELMPATHARSVLALRGEACVQFVALTRARRELVFVRAAEGSLPNLPDPPDDLSAEDAERDAILRAWHRVISLASAGRRHRGQSGRSRITSVGRTGRTSARPGR